MKKNFFKKLASGLALAMVVTSFAPAAPALAATATKIVKQGGAKAPTTVYVGKKVDYSLNKVYGTNTYKWFTSNAAVAKVTKTGGVVTPVAAGAATIKVNAYKKSTGKFVKSFTLKLDVKQRATSVEIGAEDFELAVGETKDLNAVKTPATSTDTLRYFSSNEKVATVDVKTGLVKAVAAGEATIKVASKGAWFTSNTSKYNKYDEVKVTVVDGLLKVDQKSFNKLELTFSKDMEKETLKVADFSIVRDETNRVIAVNKVEATGKVVTVTTFESMVDGKTYTVTYGDKKVQFKATDNTVASLAIAPATVAANVETEVTVSTVDANGVVLGTYNLNETEAKLDFSITTTQGYTNGNKLVLFAVGNTAKAKATYHTFKYDTNGNELGAIESELTITAVDKTAVNVKRYDYTVAQSAPNWNSFTPNTKLATKDDNYRLFFRAIKSDDTQATASEYSFESSNPDVLLVYDDATLNPVVKAVAQGTAYVLVKDTKGNVVFSLPVTIVAERKTGSITLSTNAISLSNKVTLGDTKVVTITARDQYSDKMSAPAIADITVACVSTTATGTSSIVKGSKYFDITAAGQVTFKGEGVEVGTYNYKITVDGFSQIVAVTVQAPGTGTNIDYRLVVDTNTIDTTFTGNSQVGNRDITIKIAKLNDGVVDGYLNLATIEGNTQDVDDSNIVIKRGSTAVTGSSITTDTLTFRALEVSGLNVSKKTAGSYSISIAFTDHNGHARTLTSGFVITDTQSPLIASRNKVSATLGSGAAQAVVDTFDFYYEGNKLSLTAADIIKVKEANITSGTQHFIESVTLYVKVNNGGLDYKVPVTVNIGQTISF